MGSKWVMYIKQGKLKREELGGQRGLALKLQSWRHLLLDAEGIEHFLRSMAFGRCCASSQRKVCARVKGWQEQPHMSCCHEKAPHLVSPSERSAWVLEELTSASHRWEGTSGDPPAARNSSCAKQGVISALPGSCLGLVPAARLWWHIAAGQQSERNNYAPVISSLP